MVRARTSGARTQVHSWSKWYVHIPRSVLEVRAHTRPRYVYVPQSYIQANPSCTYQCTSQLCTTSDLFSTAPSFMVWLFAFALEVFLKLVLTAGSQAFKKSVSCINLGGTKLIKSHYKNFECSTDTILPLFQLSSYLPGPYDFFIQALPQSYYNNIVCSIFGEVIQLLLVANAIQQK